MILVNGSNHLNPADMGLSYDELFNLSQKYRLHIFNGNVKVKSIGLFYNTNRIQEFF